MSPLTHLHDPASHYGPNLPTLEALAVYKIASGHNASVYWHIALLSDRTLYLFESTDIQLDQKQYPQIAGVTTLNFLTRRRAMQRFRHEQDSAARAGWDLLQQKI